VRLIHNLTGRRGKYAVVRMTKMPSDPGRRADIEHAFRILEDNGMLEWGSPGSANEFFVLMLRDVYAASALQIYAIRAHRDDPEYAREVFDLAVRSHRRSDQRAPD
jgi:hypothetical protein